MRQVREQKLRLIRKVESGQFVMGQVQDFVIRIGIGRDVLQPIVRSVQPDQRGIVRDVELRQLVAASLSSVSFGRLIPNPVNAFPLRSRSEEHTSELQSLMSI